MFSFGKSTQLNLEEAFSRLISINDTFSKIAAEEIETNFNPGFGSFLCRKFQETRAEDVHKKIFQILISKASNLSKDDFNEVFKLFKKFAGSYPNYFLQIFSSLTPAHLSVLEASITSIDRPLESKIIQNSLKNSGLIDQEIQNWTRSTFSQKNNLLERLVKLQHPLLYPIFLEILNIGFTKSDDEKRLQGKLVGMLKLIKDRQFLDTILENLPDIHLSAYPQIFQNWKHLGSVFFEKLSEKLIFLNESALLKISEILKELADINSISTTFQLLSEKSEKIQNLAATTIETLIKNTIEELEPIINNPEMKSDIKARIISLKAPLLDYFRKEGIFHQDVLGESLFQLCRLDEECFYAGFPFILLHAKSALINYLKTLDGLERRRIFIRCWNWETPETPMAMMSLFKDSESEQFISGAFDQIIINDFQFIPEKFRKEVLDVLYSLRGKDILIRTLQNQDEKISCQIIDFLGKIDSFSVLPILFSRKLDPSPSVRLSVLKALKHFRFKFDEVDENISDFLLDEDSRIAYEAIKIVREGGNSSFIAKLNNLMLSTTQKSLKENAFEAIISITRHKLLKNFDEISQKNRRSIALTLMKSDKFFVPEIIQDFKSDQPEKRRMSVKLMLLIWPEMTQDNNVIDLLDGINDPDPFIRASFAKILPKSQILNERKKIFDLFDDKDSRVKANAIEGASDLKNVIDQSTIKRLQSFVFHENNRIRANALVSLWKLGMPNLDFFLMKMLKNNNKLFQTSGIYAVGELKEIRFFPTLVQFVRSNDPDFRRNAAIGLGKLSNFPPALEHLKRIKSDPDGKVQKTVNEILAN
ncbi:MAG: HEAT repeat domain-containing protein [Candidatus Riflebacteria bacterium]|nr:HEAT repeat domain-containing protein [Candidatus Riflebacteria bacterium]